MEKSRCLITGTSGLIGSHALEYLLGKTDWDFICPNSWKHKGTPERLTRFLTPELRERVDFIYHDIQSPFTETTMENIGNIDYIINFASESHVERSIVEPVPFIKNNVDVVLTMLELARVKKPKVFVQISTDEVYGSAPDGVNYKEWSRIMPSNPYAASKCCQEAIAISYWRTYGVPLIITNTVNNFGEMQDSEKFLARIIKNTNEGKTVTVHTGKKIGARFYTYVKNHADAILYLIQNTTPTQYAGEEGMPDRYNVTSEDELNNEEMYKKVVGLMGKEENYELVDFHKDRPGHDRRYALDNTKLKELGWTPPFTLDESLTKYIKSETK